MIKLLKPIRRELMLRAEEGRYRGNNVIIELQPGDMAEFRIKGTSQRFSVSLALCYQLAKKKTLDRQYNEKEKQFKINKQQGKRATKPKRPFFPYKF